MVKMKSVLYRIVPVILFVTLIVSLAVPAFAYPYFPLPDKPSDYFHFDYVPDLGSGTFACLEKIPYGFYQPYLPASADDPDGPLFLPPIHFSSSSHADLGDGISGDASVLVSEFDILGVTCYIRYSIINLDNPLMGYNCGISTLVTGDGMSDTYFENSLGLYLIPLSSTDQVPVLSPTEYFEFGSPDPHGTLEGSFMLPDGNYYAIFTDGDDTYFSESFYYSAEYSGSGAYSNDFLLDVYYAFDDVGLLTVSYHCSIVALDHVPVSFFTVLDDTGSFVPDSVRFVRIPDPSDKLLVMWSEIGSWFGSSLTASSGMLYSAETGLTSIGVFAVACGGLSIIIGIVAAIRSWLKRR